MCVTTVTVVLFVPTPPREHVETPVMPAPEESLEHRGQRYACGCGCVCVFFNVRGKTGR